MRFIRFLGKDNKAHTAVEINGSLIDLEKTASSKGISDCFDINYIINGGSNKLEQIKELIKENSVGVSEEITYLPPVETPEKILCVGLNYYDHRKECNDFPKSPEDPVLFSKFPNAIASHNEKIELSSIANQYDYEAELVIVMGKDAKNVSAEEAPNYIFGYTAGNDFSARDLQFKSGQWLIGKSMDKFAPIGPCLVTADELDVGNLDISCKLNGETRQSANTSDMIFSPAKIVAYASSIMTLKAGDIIFTGTPGGVILGIEDPNKKWVQSGDTVEVTIQGIGTLCNKFV